MHSAWFRSTFLRVLKFLQIKEGGPNFWVEPILQKVWIIWSPLLYFNFKNFLDPNSVSFIRFQCILHDSGVLFSEFWNFYKLKRGNLIYRENQLCRKSKLLGPPPLLFFNFKRFMDPNCASSPPKSQIFLWTSKILKFSSLIPSYLLKVTKFLGNFPVWILSYDWKVLLLITFFCH